jgi:transcription factor TFIIIB component B''
LSLDFFQVLLLLCNFFQHRLTEELSDDGEYTDKESQYHEGALSDHGVKEQSKMNGEKLDLSMKLRNRRKEVGVSEHITDDNFDEDYAEPSAAEQDNDSGDEYTAGEKQKPQRKSREKDPDKEPVRGSRRTSKNLAAEKPPKQSQQKNKSEGHSRGRKRALKDASTEQPEKKLTHRIRQKRTKGILLK